MSLASAIASSSVSKLEHRRDRAKDLFLHEAHLGLRLGDDGRLEERAAKRVALAAGDDLAALGRGVVDQFLDLLDRLLVDQRPLLHALLEAGADLQLALLAAASFSTNSS